MSFVEEKKICLAQTGFNTRSFCLSLAILKPGIDYKLVSAYLGCSFFLKRKLLGWMWWHIPVITALWYQRHTNQFKALGNNIASLKLASAI